MFNDRDAERRILQAKHPGEAKQIGREITGFDEARWLSHRFDIVVKGGTKFTQNVALGKFLLDTQDRVLVEASPVDRIWGIGLAADDVAAQNPCQWRGLNLLGFALMAVRAALQSQ